ncbi:GNAT family N-acetyltransferase [Clostridium cellulovorans]|uniref:GCN5-related N-acetyltransferase n=1 Tax=Clostridium cellulovorans (strain ATCC 35296 / DSM 3052 / OCM 3 / 743B) TaxID=573061 RepID=D9SWA2_CLOC7|nr:GNAT family N-acetyltransferase [Clostridium cellulovorans]ADL51246.1 GCN5-related N-acetyltransferase [Clostridium cellulovorans 743B]
MQIELRELERKDYDKAIEFAIEGMHFNRYTENKKELYMYGKYFLYMEMQRATQMIAAYMGKKLVGLVLADVKGEPKSYRSIWKGLYVKIMELIMKIIGKGRASSYEEANRKMLQNYKKKADVDGEICFVAADPNIQGKGIGSYMMKELEQREAGKLLYLFTDSNCTYHFYEHRGFQQVGSQDIMLQLGRKEVPLTCFLFSKQMMCRNEVE